MTARPAAEDWKSNPHEVSVTLAVHLSFPGNVLSGQVIKIREAKIEQNGKSYLPWFAEAIADGQAHILTWPRLECRSMTYVVSATRESDDAFFAERGEIQPTKTECKGRIGGKGGPVFKRVNLFELGPYIFGDWGSQPKESIAEGVRG